MKKIIYVAIVILTLPLISYASMKQKGDTVIIELDGNSRIVIITKNKADLANIQKYDINQMIKDLNAQLEDSVDYLVIEGSEPGKEYVSGDDRINRREDISVDLDGIRADKDRDDFDDDDWRRRNRVTYDAKRVDRTTHHFNFDLGLNNWLEDGNFPDINNSPYSVKPFGSWYVALNSTNKTWIGGPLFLEWGVGVSWYNWKLEDSDYKITETDPIIDFINDPNINGLKSKLTVSYLNAQLVPMFDFSRGRRKVSGNYSGVRRYSRRGFRFGLGGYAGYRLGSHTKFIFKDGGSKEKDKEHDNFFLENFRYGLRGQIGWKGVEFFGTYDMNEVFSSGRGPALNAITFGMTF